MYSEFLKYIDDFMFIDDKPQKADVIFIPGNGYPQMAEHAAELFYEGFADFVLPSGKYSVINGKFGGVLDKQDQYNGFYKTEWEFLKDVLIKNGVPEPAVLREDQATYTWENACFSRNTLDRAGITVKNAILCCKTHHARRAYMYYQKAFPDTRFMICPSCVDGIRKENWRQTELGIETVMGEMTRIVRQFSLMM